MIKMLIMGKRCHINVRVFVCLLFVAVSNTEIHRAKPNPSKFSVKSTQSEDTSYVAEPNGDNLENWKVNMFDIRYETWFYAIFASILVGLSGIFPLLVIPIEAGPSLKHGAAAARLKLLLSFAVGGLLGDVFLHLLPEAWEHQRGGHQGSTAEGHRYLGLWIITGMLSFLIIEKIFAKEDEFEHLQDECLEAEEEEKYQNDKTCQPLHEQQTGSCSNHMDADYVHSDRSNQPSTSVHRNNKKQNILQNNNLKQKTKPNSASSANHKKKQIKSVKSTDNGISKDKSDIPSLQEPGIKVSGYLNLAANVIDNFTHGLAVAGGFLVNNKVGFITTLAILLHEIPHEIGDFAILLRSGFNRWKAAKAQLLTATGGMIGALTALTADSAQAAGERTLWVLPFTSGGFIYIALVTVVPDLMEEKHPRESTKQILCLLAGVGAMYLVSMVH